MFYFSIIKKIDAYIIGKYISSFLFTMLLISMISVVIDFSEKIHKFIDADLSTLEVIKGYYLPFIPWINGLMWPLFSLIAVIFFTSRLAKNTELLAILSSGVSFNRILVSYVTAASILATIFWFGKNHIIPYSNKVKNDFEYEYLTKKHLKTRNSDVHFFLGPNEKVHNKYYSKRDTSVRGFRIETFEDGKLVKVLKAKKLVFKEAPNRWTIKDYEVRTFNGLEETLLVEAKVEKDTTLNMTPSDFIQNLKEMENMTTGDLKEFIEREKDKGLGASKSFLIQLHQRNSEPFSIIILTIIGAAIASRKVRGGMGLHLAIGVTLGAAFVIITQFSATFSNNLSLSPALGAWLPNILFGMIAAVLVIKSQK